ncbi:T9SS type A sorting domain-containing protein [Hymenobacter sp. RP-2-7]|uniref:T9SS type A sorting domain-containing protein n=1 Tax=Hymenobacter polaris TaxID=2682546 RepID=A0A7Y0AEJ0_9BACT|nr:T9SS type A sorting domain-containing protein [Hymenobacter polaris]NML65615.1 T9SS type A sorting domain-containing protein [Hymenobacter polaris]
MATIYLGGEASTRRVNGDNVLQDGMTMYYRVHPKGVNTGAFAALPLTYLRSGDDGQATSQTWSNTYTRPNIVGGLNAGTYELEVYFQGTATYNNSGGSGSFTFYDNNGGNNYKAVFTITGTRLQQAQWTGNSNNDWFTASNWSSNTVPDENTDVVIPFNTTNRPRIGSGVAYTHDLTLTGNPSGPGLSLFQDAGQLKIYGDFTDNNGAFQQTGGTFTLASTSTVRAQSFTGESLFNISIEGGTMKILNGRLSVLQNLDFRNGGGILLTDPRDIQNAGVDLSATTSGQTVYDATITNESETSYVQGILRTTRLVTQGATNYFGGIGIDLLVTTGQPNNVVVTRSTGGTYGFNYTGVGTSQSIRRGFKFQPDNPSGLTFNVIFHYLDAELTNTAGNNTNIKESDLRLFRSVSGGVPFEGLGYTAMSAATNTLTRTGITGTLAATFTLGDINNPLPVELVSFTAAGTAQGAALKWLTASEVNSKGFGIERQVAGATTWQSVGYVAATNLANGSSYSFLDKTLPAAATQVYYRLRQEDTDGSLHYSAVAAVSRAALGTDLTLSPVPLQGGPLAVSFAEAGQAGTEIVVLNVQGQRVAHYTTAASTDAAVSLPLDNLAAGVYVLSVQVPGQATRHARFVKQ